MNQHMFQETIPIRKGEDFDQNAVKKYLRESIEGFPEEPLEVTQFSTGVSNLTYHLRAGNWEAVMRRPPNGPLPPKAHDMKRESEFLKKLYPYYSFVPKPYVFCDDKSVIGVPFYVMEHKKGIVIDESFPPGQNISADQLKTISYNVVDALADLHQIDYEKVGLSEFGYPEGFLNRQVHGWIKRFNKSKTDDVPYFEELSKWMVNHVPASHDSAVIHNDYKLNNMLFSQDLRKINAVLDWELATVADPFFDLAGALGYWVEEKDPDLLKESLPSLTGTPGFISREEFIHRYALKTKKNIPDMNFYMAFTYFKLAVVFQQIYYRWKIGKSNDERFKTFDKRARNMMTHAYEVVDKKMF
ncbi:Predicted kinase, aminoglycoside phosphotransferase (APT) family [Alteribacillus persepolensis]|uniref:Predicted kinase, aminoglycoside phosphotransferase (APT) family n=1 Tax=Alteribacillus persepolensis TaxID=568899 RepID=A0A1G8HT47_9BACI|nr:phosphotransferase family protein [Alteribacillus persepolensis]SDI09670.1 Predicted kinase, aminoglycoside phosphotransferase (APT) family [Alteribacillus persepolensis]